MVNEKISLVSAGINDWQKVLEFEKTSQSKFFAALKNEKEARDYLSESKVFFIKLGKEFIGTASFKPEKDSAYLDGLTIAPNYRGKGYSKIALHLIMEKASSFKRAYLRVHPQNTAGLMIYLKEGFKIISWEENHFGDNEPRVVMEKVY